MSTDRRPLALATCAVMPAEADEAPLEAALVAAGVDYEWAVWDDDAIDWSRFAAVLIRTTWDYTARVDAFRAWARRVEAVTPLWNPAAVVAWNSHKRYLLDLADAGVAVVPTLHVAAADPIPDLAACRARPGWTDLVVKPAEAVGSDGLSRWRADVPDGEVAEAVRALQAAGQDVLVQPFLPAIATGGETSVVFVDGEPSHAIVKVPAEGDIRSQPEHGGRLSAVSPTGDQIALGRTALAAAASQAGVRPDALVYARVDCVDHDGLPLLMELELIEPDLFVGFEAGAADRVAGAVAQRLRASSR